MTTLKSDLAKLKSPSAENRALLKNLAKLGVTLLKSG